MDFIIEDWFIIVVAFLIAVYAVFAVLRWRKKSVEDRYAQIRGWLLQAVLLAQKEYGVGTGRLKLSSVYAEFCVQLPWLAKVVTFEQFSRYVDDALSELKAMLESNAAISAIVESKGEN